VCVCCSVRFTSPRTHARELKHTYAHFSMQRDLGGECETIQWINNNSIKMQDTEFQEDLKRLHDNDPSLTDIKCVVCFCLLVCGFGE